MSEVQFMLGTGRAIKSPPSLPASVSTAQKGQTGLRDTPSHTPKAHFTPLPSPLPLWFFWVLGLLILASQE